MRPGPRGARPRATRAGAGGRGTGPGGRSEGRATSPSAPPPRMRKPARTPRIWSRNRGARRRGGRVLRNVPVLRYCQRGAIGGAAEGRGGRAELSGRKVKRRLAGASQVERRSERPPSEDAEAGQDAPYWGDATAARDAEAEMFLGTSLGG